MEIRTLGKSLVVESKLFIDEDYVFCGRPYISLLAYHKETDFLWTPYSIAIGVRDDDDYDIGLIYQTNENNFFDMLHELINWMRDHEQGITKYEDILKPFKFFPDLGCERERW